MLCGLPVVVYINPTKSSTNCPSGKENVKVYEEQFDFQQSSCENIPIHESTYLSH